MHLRVIYKNKLHLIATFAVMVLPLLFFVIFSKVANLSLPLLLSNLALSSVRLVVAYCIAAVLG